MRKVFSEARPRRLYGKRGKQMDSSFHPYRDHLRKIRNEIEKLFRFTGETASASQNITYKELTGESNHSIQEYWLNGIKTPAEDLVKRPGKLWRPLMMTLICEAYGGGDRALPLSPLIELAHTGTLIIDDIEDRSSYRRGEKAIHLKYGEATAVNTGNLLYFLPTVVIDRSPLSDGEKAAVYRFYTEEMRKLHFGQGLDIQWHDRWEPFPREEEYLQVCRFKTGSLARLGARIGALLAGQEEGVIEQCGRLLEEIGVGFQIIDDTKNISLGNPGKQRGDDIIEGKKSLPVILFCHRYPEKIPRLKTLFSRSRSEEESSRQAVIEETIALLHEGGSVREAEKIGNALLQRGKASLGEIFPESSAALTLIQSLVERFLSEDSS